MTSSAAADATVVFLDANVLAKPVTRTLLMAGGLPSGFRAAWSLAAEQEASRHMRPRATPPSVVRESLGLELTPSGTDSTRFVGTTGADRQILADAAAARASFLVTEDVDDFGADDLASVGISAVNPDLFLAERLTRDAYALVIELFARRQVNPPTTRERFHAAIGRNHPRLFLAHASLYAVEADPSAHNAPAHLFRGLTCLRCERTAHSAETTEGVCTGCR